MNRRLEVALGQNLGLVVNSVQHHDVFEGPQAAKVLLTLKSDLGDADVAGLQQGLAQQGKGFDA